MFELTNRELATVILFGVFVGVFSLVPNLRREVGPSLVSVLRSFFVWKIQVPLLIYFAYAAGLVYVAWQLNLWESWQLKDTLIVVFFVGLPLLFGASSVNEGKKLVGNVVRDAVGVSALIVFYVGFGSLSLWAELILQPIVGLLSLLAVVALHNPEHRPVGKLANGLLGFIGLWLFVYTTKTIISDWDGGAWSDAAKSLILSIWLPFALIPFVYAFAFIMHAETILTMLPFFNDRKRPKVRVRMAGVWGLRFSTRLASEFTGRWRGELAQSGGFRDALRVMTEFRAAVKQRDRDLHVYDENLAAMAGVLGVDDDGLQRDRREFYATKRELTNFYFMQMGWHRSRGEGYRPELLDLLGDMTKKGLPEDHGIQLVVRNDRQAWRAWRRTPAGWYFGVGGTANVEDQWQYDGSMPPNRFPSTKSPGWVNATSGSSSPEWAKNDEPPLRT
ncbi:hypothetical protein ACHAAC_09270 [Aeromicrobium sp. CF4.19]|uniref:hypothetical protein n=1 Tax=Aeromicrobium sp. CF4.19 TaxID=3373082 RepID=UPI003EE63867